MKDLPVALLVFYVAVSSAFGLKCNNCSSTTSLEDCDNNKKEETCHVSQNRCITLILNTISNVTRAFSRGCSTRNVCDSGSLILNALCKGDNGTCALYCCEDDLCNTASTTASTATLTTASTTALTTAQKSGTADDVIGIIFIVACAIVAFFS